MSKRILFAFITAIICIVLNHSTGFSIQNQTEKLSFFVTTINDTLNIPYLDVAPVIDGNKNDWQSIQEPHCWDSTISPHLQNSISYNFGWDEEYLYAIVIVHDADLCTVLEREDTLELHLNDAVEIWLDSKNDSKKIIDGNDFHFMVDVLQRTILFRGDKTLMDLHPDSSDVPQSYGITPIVYKYAIGTDGLMNNSEDIDSSFTVEMAIPWSAIGVESHAGFVFKMDLINDDQDSALISKSFERTDTLKDKAFLFRYHFVNWIGEHDFGYPPQWRCAKLIGSPGIVTTLSKEYSKFWLLAFLLTTVGSFSVIGLMSYRLYKLKQMPVRDEVVRHKSGKFVLDQIKSPEQGLIEEQTLQQDSHQQKLISKARLYIESNIDQLITSEILADHLAISVRQLQRIIKEELQSTPTNFIHIIRLEKGASMLKKKEGNITEIALAVGFSDSSHFSRLFKRYYGVAPSQYIHKD